MNSKWKNIGRAGVAQNLSSLKFSMRKLESRSFCDRKEKSGDVTDNTIKNNWQCYTDFNKRLYTMIITATFCHEKHTRPYIGLLATYLITIASISCISPDSNGNRFDTEPLTFVTSDQNKSVCSKDTDSDQCISVWALLPGRRRFAIWRWAVICFEEN